MQAIFVLPLQGKRVQIGAVGGAATIAAVAFDGAAEAFQRYPQLMCFTGNILIWQLQAQVCQAQNPSQQYRRDRFKWD